MRQNATLLALPIAAALLSAAPAHAEVIAKSDAGFVVRETVEVTSDVWASWAGLIAPAKWWNPEHTWSGKADTLYIDSQATGCFCELMPVPDGAPEGTRRGSVEHLRIIQSSPGKVLRMKGGLGPLQSEAAEGVLTITLKPTPKGTRLLWEYVVGGYMRMKPEAMAPAVDAMLGEQAGRLGKLLGLAEPAQASVKSEPAPKTEPAATDGASMKAESVAIDAPAGETAAPKAEADVGAQFDAAIDKPAPAKAIKPVAKPKPAAKPAAKPAPKKPAA